MFKKLWAGYLFQSGDRRAAPAALTGSTGAPRPAIRRRGTALRPVRPRPLRGLPAGGQHRRRPTPAILSLLAASSPASVLSKITAPTLLTQGEQDSLFPLTEADANARGIAATGTAGQGRLARRRPRRRHLDRRNWSATSTGWFDPILQHGQRRRPSAAVRAGAASVRRSRPRPARRSPQTLQVDAGYPGLGGADASRSTVPVAGPPQVIIAPAGGNPAAITDVPEIGGLLTQAAALGRVDRAERRSRARSPASRRPGSTTTLLIAGASTVTLSGHRRRRRPTRPCSSRCTTSRPTGATCCRPAWSRRCG